MPSTHSCLPRCTEKCGIAVCKYVIATNIYIYCYDKRAQQQARAPSNEPIPIWKHLPNRDIDIQTHPVQSIPLHPPCVADKGPIYAINYPEPKYIFFPPKNAPRRTQKCETVSGHLGNSDYEVSHVVDTCLQVPPTPPNSALAPPSHLAPSASDIPYPPSQRTILLILMSPGSLAG